MYNHKKGIIVFLLLAFGIAWGSWAVPLLAGLRPADGILFTLAIAPGAFAPALAAIIVRKWVTREGFGDAGLKPNLRKWPYYLFAWLLPIFVIGIVVVLATASNTAAPDYSLERGFPLLTGGTPAPEGITFSSLLLAYLLTAPFLAPLLWGEEFGWRGYLQTRLYTGQPLKAAAATGVIWGVWHLPVNMVGYNDVGERLLSSALFMAAAILMSIIFGWLQQQTGSCWAPSLGHAAHNNLGGSISMLLFKGGQNYAWVSYGGIFSLIPLGLVCLGIVLTSHRAEKPALSSAASR
jgi:uncharacterized protein